MNKKPNLSKDRYFILSLFIVNLPALLLIVYWLYAEQAKIALMITQLV